MCSDIQSGVTTAIIGASSVAEAGVPCVGDKPECVDMGQSPTFHSKCGLSVCFISVAAAAIQPPGKLIENRSNQLVLWSVPEQCWSTKTVPDPNRGTI